MNKIFLSLFFFSSNFFAIIINENMGNINNWYDSDDKFPFVVQRTKGNSGMFCTGTLINSRTVISSAHCSKNVFNEVWMGNDISNQNTQVAVTSEISHPDYSPIGQDLDEEHDISIISLATPVYSISDFPTLNSSTTEDQKEVFLVGYGVKGDNSGYLFDSPATENQPDGKRRWVKNKVYKIAHSTDYLGTTFDEPTNDFYIENEGFIAPGDSGGPVLIETSVNKYLLIGVHSSVTTQGSGASKTSGEYSNEGSHTSIKELISWINANLPLKFVSSSADGVWSSTSSWDTSIIPDNFENVTSGNQLNSTQARYYNVSISNNLELSTTKSIDNLDLNNTGKINIGTTGILNLAGKVEANNSSIVLNGTLNSIEVNLKNSSVVSGTGTMTGNLILGSSHLKPGNSIGTLNINGNLSLDSTSETEIEIDALGKSDSINVSGLINLNGTLKLVPLEEEGRFFKKGMSYTYLNYGSSNGNFSAKSIKSNVRTFGFLSFDLSQDLKQLTLSNPVYKTLAGSTQTYNIASSLDNLERIKNSNTAIYNSLQTVLDEINLSANINTLNDQILYFSPDLNKSIAINITNLIHLKNEMIKHRSFKNNINIQIQKKEIEQKNNISSTTESLILAYKRNEFLSGISIDKSTLPLKDDSIDSLSFFASKNNLFKKENLSLNIIYSSGDSELTRERTLNFNTLSKSELLRMKSSFDSSSFYLGVNYSKEFINLPEWQFSGGLGLVYYDQDGFQESNHPRNLNLTFENFSDSFLIGSLNAKYESKALTFNDSLKLVGNVYFDYVSDAGEINSFIHKDLGSIKIDNNESLEDLYGIELVLIKDFKKSSLSFNFGFGNAIENYSLNYGLNF